MDLRRLEHLAESPIVRPVLCLSMLGCSEAWTLSVIPHTIAGQAPFDGAPLVDLHVPQDDGTVLIEALGTAEAERSLEGVGPLPEGSWLGLYVHETDEGQSEFAGLRAWGRALVPAGAQGGDGEVVVDLLVPMSHVAGQLGSFEPEQRRFLAAAASLAGGEAFLFGGIADPTVLGAEQTDVLRLAGLDDGDAVAVVAGALPPASGGARLGATATTVFRGEAEMILIAGGRSSVDDLGGSYDDWYLFDPAVGGVIQQGRMAVGRSGHAAVPLASGEVLLFGGTAEGEVGVYEYFDPLVGAIRTGGEDLGAAPVGFGVADLGVDGVLVCGGADECTEARVAAAACNADQLGAWVVTERCALISANGIVEDALPLLVAVAGHAMSPLPDGRVLSVGGLTADTRLGDNLAATDSAWIRKSDGSWRGIGSSIQPRAHHQIVPLSTGNLLLVGGSAGGAAVGFDGVVAVACIEVFQGLGEQFAEVVDGCAPMAGGAMPTLTRPGPDGVVIIGGIRAAGVSWDGADGWGLIGLGPP